MKLQQPAPTTVTEQPLPRRRKRNPCLTSGDKYSRETTPTNLNRNKKT